MSTVIKICGVAIITLFASLLLQKSDRLWAFVPVGCAFVIILIFCISNYVSQSVESLEALANTAFSSGAEALTKALGIAVITSVTGEICESAGVGMLEKVTGFAGKMQIIMLCIPLITKLITLAGETL